MKAQEDKSETRQKQSDGNPVLDGLFYLAFYLSVSFLPAFLGLFDRRTVHVPLILIGVLILARMAMRPQTRQRIMGIAKIPPILLLLLFTGLVLIYAVGGIIEDGDRARLIGKPISLILATTLLAFVWTHRDVIDHTRIAKGMFFGGLAGFIGVLFITGWGLALQTFGFSNFPNPPGPVYVVALNDELKIISTLMFFAAAIMSDRRHIYVLMALCALAVLWLSFNTMGFGYSADGQGAVTRAWSETVLFGLPVALLVLAVSMLIPVVMTHVVFAGIFLLLAAAPWIFQGWFYVVQNVELPRARKFLERGEIWDAVATQSLKAPFLGHGLESCRFEKVVQHAQVHFKGGPIWHPHNMFLQLWLDMGIVGVIPVLALVYLGWQFVRATPLNGRALVLAGLTMVTIFAVATHSLWQTWVIALFAFVAVLISLRAEPAS